MSRTLIIEYIDNPTTHMYNHGYNGPGYYFWDETDVFCYGPFESYARTVVEMEIYLALVIYKGF